MQAQQISELASAGFFRGTRVTERSEVGVVGCHFFWVLFFGQAKKSTSPTATKWRGESFYKNIWMPA
jgi:hypothetical protein